MPATLLDGKQTAAAIRGDLAQDVRRLAARGVVPGLGVVLVGEHPASISYVTAKERACAEIGIRSEEHRLPADAAQSDLMALVRVLNADPKIHGILVQLPLPAAMREDEVLLAVDAAKDVDGFHPLNVGRLVLGQPAYRPCTPHGIVELLARHGIATAGAHVVIVGRSNIVGKPLANLLLQKHPRGNATVTVCHTGTPDLGRFTRQADILVAAAGRPNTITAGMVRPGAVVIDVGVNRVPDPSRPKGFRLVGDVDFDAVREVAGSITPVPGGVGPMTIAMLLFNTVEAARRAADAA